MQHSFFLFISAFWCTLSFAQDTTFYDKSWQRSSRTEATYYRIVSEEDSRWVKRDFFRSNDQPQSVAFYLTRDFKRPIGKLAVWFESGAKYKIAVYDTSGAYTQTLWYENGQVKNKGQYNAKDQRIGTWEEYYESGPLSQKGEYKQGGKFGRWQYWYENKQAHQVLEFVRKGPFGFKTLLIDFWDRTGEQTLKDGTGSIREVFNDSSQQVRFEGEVENKKRVGLWTVYHPDGSRMESVFYDKKGMVHGLHQYFYPDGKIEMEGHWKHGKKSEKWVYKSPEGEILWEKTYDTPETASYRFGEREPLPINMKQLVQYIGYPKEARDAGIEGQMIVRVLISKEGRYEKHRIIRSPHPMIDKVVEAHLDKIRFIPGIQRSGYIKFWVNIPFNFQLN
ncbi:MAG: TonB family protein [Bacteroidota bacterium]